MTEEIRDAVSKLNSLEVHQIRSLMINGTIPRLSTLRKFCLIGLIVPKPENAGWEAAEGVDEALSDYMRKGFSATFRTAKPSLNEEQLW